MSSRTFGHSICHVNLVRFVTAERDNGKKMQNSGVMVARDHTGDARDFYGVLKEIKELAYISSEKQKRTVVLFGYDWYCLERARGMPKLEKYDKLFRSINISSLWYEDDKYILSTQAQKVFYVPDTLEGQEWWIVQKFEHRRTFDVSKHDKEKDEKDNDEEDKDEEDKDEEERPSILSHQYVEVSDNEDDPADPISHPPPPATLERTDMAPRTLSADEIWAYIKNQKKCVCSIRKVKYKIVSKK